MDQTLSNPSLQRASSLIDRNRPLAHPRRSSVPDLTTLPGNQDRDSPYQGMKYSQGAAPSFLTPPHRTTLIGRANSVHSSNASRYFDPSASDPYRIIKSGSGNLSSFSSSSNPSFSLFRAKSHSHAQKGTTSIIGREDITIHNISSIVSKSKPKRRRPPFSYSCLIAQAILESPHQMLTLREIYSWIIKQYPDLYKMEDSSWQNTIRHNLSLNKSFKRVERVTVDGRTGKGGYWQIDRDRATSSLASVIDKYSYHNGEIPSPSLDPRCNFVHIREDEDHISEDEHLHSSMEYFSPHRHSHSRNGHSALPNSNNSLYASTLVGDSSDGDSSDYSSRNKDSNRSFSKGKIASSNLRIDTMTIGNVNDKQVEDMEVDDDDHRSYCAAQEQILTPSCYMRISNLLNE